jgi:hypothetical protein
MKNFQTVALNAGVSAFVGSFSSSLKRQTKALSTPGRKIPYSSSCGSVKKKQSPKHHGQTRLWILKRSRLPLVVALGTYIYQSQNNDDDASIRLMGSIGSLSLRGR